MIVSRPQSGVYLITRDEIARLHEPGNAAIREPVEEALGLLHSLFSRYGSLGHRWFDLDEEAACRELHGRMEALRDHDPYWRRIAEDVDRYLRLRNKHAEEGTTFGTMEWADNAADAVLDRLSFLAAYPELARVQRRLAEVAGVASAA